MAERAGVESGPDLGMDWAGFGLCMQTLYADGMQIGRGRGPVSAWGLAIQRHFL